MTSVHPFLRSFRDYCSQSLAPFYFGAATYTGPRNALTTSSPPDIAPVPNVDPLLKFDATFVNQNDVTPNTTAWIALHAPCFPATPAAPRRTQPAPAPDQIAEQRRRTLRHHFPVTLERIRRARHLAVLFPPLLPNTAHWQVEQAICNLLLAVQTGARPHFQGLTAKQVRNHVTQAIASRSETADGQMIPFFTPDQITTQILADGNALLRLFKKKRRANISRLQEALSSLCLLDAPGVANDPCKGSSL